MSLSPSAVYRIIVGSFLTSISCKVGLTFVETDNKQKEASDGPFLKKTISAVCQVKFC